MFRKIIEWLFSKYNEVFFVGATDKLPPPLSKEEELKYLVRAKAGDEEARNILIEHNLRLVVYIARKFDNTGINNDRAAFNSCPVFFCFTIRRLLRLVLPSPRSNSPDIPF